jgi:hypothetical protein
VNGRAQPAVRVAQSPVIITPFRGVEVLVHEPQDTLSVEYLRSPTVCWLIYLDRCERGEPELHVFVGYASGRSSFRIPYGRRVPRYPDDDRVPAFAAILAAHIGWKFCPRHHNSPPHTVLRIEWSCVRQRCGAV